MTTIYFVRHAEPDYNNHDDRQRELTKKGLQDRKFVTDFLLDKQIDVVLSSPYVRAFDTVADFAETVNLKIETIEGFRERKVDDVWIDDFDAFSKKQWEDFTYKLADGETLGEVQNRNIKALQQVLKLYHGKNIVIGSHGTALSTIINYYDKTFGYTAFEKIRKAMPWIVKFVFDDENCQSMESYQLLGNSFTPVSFWCVNLPEKCTEGGERVLETKRLFLRYFTEGDAKEAHELFCEEEAMRMAGMYPPFVRLEETRKRISEWITQKNRLAIVLKETGALAGYIAIHPDSEEGREDTRELGFALLAKYRKQGYMKEAVNAVLEELAEQGIVYVWACCFQENTASEKLIRSLGFEFVQEGVFYSWNDREYPSLEFKMTLSSTHRKEET